MGWRTARLSLTCRVTGGVRQNPSSSIVSAMAASLLSGNCRLFYDRKSADKPPILICRGCNARVNCSSVHQMMSRSTFAGLRAHTSQEITMVASSMLWYAAGSGQLGSCSWAGASISETASFGSHLLKYLQLLLQNLLSKIYINESHTVYPIHLSSSQRLIDLVIQSLRFNVCL